MRTKKRLHHYLPWSNGKSLTIFAFLILIAVGAFFRLYRIEDFITFLGDQGRDAIVMKRIVTGEDFPGIGPRSSIGDLFLGPFYFYIMAPFLWMFNFNPVGPAIGVAVMSIAAIGASFVIIKREWSAISAFIFLSFVTFSYTLISYSRFSWNPNLLPFFSFFTIFFAYMMLKTEKLRYGFLFGIFLGASLQLHYLMLLTLPGIALVFGYYLFRNSDKSKVMVSGLGAALVGFAGIYAPMILFELKNNFLNVRGLLSIFGEKELASGEKSVLQRFLESNDAIAQHIFQTELPIWVGTALLIALIFYLWTVFKKQKGDYFIGLLGASVLSFLLLFSIIDTQRYAHYFMPIYFMIFALIASTFTYFQNKYRALVITIVMFIFFIFWNTQKYSFFTAEANQQTKRAESIARKINEASNKKPYYLLSIPLSNTNDHIRYYLEIMGNRPLSAESTAPAEELFVLCYEPNPEVCNVTEDPQYQAVIFGDRKIDQKIDHPPEVTIYKLIHAK